MEAKQIAPRFYKILKFNKTHHDHKYTSGLNILKGKFAESGSCCPGGFYFVFGRELLKWLDYGEIVVEIFVAPDEIGVDFIDAKIMRDGDKYRSNQVYLGKEWSLFDLSTFQFMMQTLEASDSKMRTPEQLHTLYVEGAIKRAIKEKNEPLIQYIVTQKQNLFTQTSLASFLSPLEKIINIKKRKNKKKNKKRGS